MYGKPAAERKFDLKVTQSHFSMEIQKCKKKLNKSRVLVDFGPRISKRKHCFSFPICGKRKKPHPHGTCQSFMERLYLCFE